MLPDRTPIGSTIRQATSHSVLRPSFLSLGILCALARHKSPYADRFRLLTIDGGKDAAFSADDGNGFLWQIYCGIFRYRMLQLRDQEVLRILAKRILGLSI